MMYRELCRLTLMLVMQMLLIIFLIMLEMNDVHWDTCETRFFMKEMF